MNKIKKIFLRMGEFLVDLLKLDRPGKGKLELQQEIISLSTGRKSSVRMHYIKKAAVFLAVLTAGLILCFICLAVYLSGEKETKMQTLARPGYGEGDRKETLTVQIEGEEEKEINVNIQERKYTDAQKKAFLEGALEELEKVLPGENDSLDEVRRDLVFPDSFQDGAVKASWLTIPYGVIGEDGSLTGSEDENGTQVEIQGTLTCAGMEMTHTVFARVFPPDLSEQERLFQSVSKEVEQADARDSHKNTVTLPEIVENRRLDWIQKKENPVLSMLIFTVLTAICASYEMDSMVHRKDRV